MNTELMTWESINFLISPMKNSNKSILVQLFQLKTLFKNKEMMYLLVMLIGLPKELLLQLKIKDNVDHAGPFQQQVVLKD
jgi:hypothetical protein